MSADPLEWMRRAACKGRGPDEFFPDDGNPTPDVAALCGGCPVRSDCLAFALEGGEDTRGIWAGTGERQRRRMRQAAGMRKPMIQPDHGTDAGYKQHKRLDESACRPCLDAHDRYQEFNRPSRARDGEAVGW